MENVAILMSTYNGGKYISEQIESIINQTYKNWKLYIRDDGSSDNTIDIIKKYIKDDSRIIFIEDNKSLRPARSFFSLLSSVEATYYFFCDQDDYWLENKLEVMLNKMLGLNNSIPQVVYCNLKCTDENLVPRKYGFDNLVGKVSGKNRLIGNDMPGCIMMFNKKVRDLFVKNLPKEVEKVSMHDWWIALIGQVFGEVHFIDERLIYYRQHSNNTLGAGKSGNTLGKLFQRDLIDKQKRLVRESYFQDLVFADAFSNQLPNDYKEILSDLRLCKKGSKIYRYHFLKKYELKQMSWIRTFAFSVVFIFLFEGSTLK
ncbi:glycosyltransferase family 2 protein [Ligilactobacillus equi]|uniref:glycosyltransferase family 2 protein n=1 Tax=Ligilactobacillus equi TaxID=137357 RepID=UPI002ED17191